MLYLQIDTNQIKILSLKRSMLGQYETNVFNKTYQGDLLTQGKITNVDFVASAIKEGVQSLSVKEIKDKDVLLILPQESYQFLRVEVPLDISPSAINSFIKDKAKSNILINLENSYHDYFVEEAPTAKIIHFFAVEKDVLIKYKEALNLIDLNLNFVLPESVAYFKLFQKTLRMDKKENIFYVNYSQLNLIGFLYDSYGQSSSEKWRVALNEKSDIEKILKERVLDFQNKDKKLNRLILGGEKSDKVRQDTFTKSIGVWTNPLKRIVPEFYAEYLKLLISSSGKPFSILSYEACVGSFIFHEENKKFSLQNTSKEFKNRLPSMNFSVLPKKEIIIFLVSFIASFLFFIAMSKMKIKIPQLIKNNQKTSKTIVAKPTIKPTTIPTPIISRESIKIKVLNGSGIPGKATDVKDILNNLGYQEILTGNADSFDYEQSILEVKKSDQKTINLLKNDLKNHTTSFKTSPLDNNEAADVIIIVGKDFK